MRYLTRLLSGQRTNTQALVALTPSVAYAVVPSGRLTGILDLDWAALSLAGDLAGSPLLRWRAHFWTPASATDLLWVQLWDLTTAAEIAVVSGPATSRNVAVGVKMIAPLPSGGTRRLQVRYKTTASPGAVKLFGWSLDMWG